MLSKADRAGKFLMRIFLCAAIILGTMVQFVSAATPGFELSGSIGENFSLWR